MDRVVHPRPRLPLPDLPGVRVLGLPHQAGQHPLLRRRPHPGGHGPGAPGRRPAHRRPHPAPRRGPGQADPPTGHPGRPRHRVRIGADGTRSRARAPGGPAGYVGGCRRPRRRRTPTSAARWRRPPTASAPPSTPSARSRTAGRSSTGWTTARPPGAATRRTRSTPRWATGCGTRRRARSCAASWSPGARSSWPGGRPHPAPTSSTWRPRQGSDTYGILSNRYLAEQARTTHYEVTVTVGDGVFSYEETTTIRHSRVTEVLEHTDRNTLHRVEAPGAHGEVSRHQQ